MAFSADEIEDGTGKTTAIVYGTSDPIAECITYLIRHAGKTAFADLTGNFDDGGANETPKQEVHLLRGVRYIELYGYRRVTGRPREYGQGLLQPRFGQYFDGAQVASDEIHQQWLRAQFEAAELSAAGEPLFHIVDSERGVKREKVSAALETEWFQGGKSEIRIYHVVTQMLDPFLDAVGQLVRG